MTGLNNIRHNLRVERTLKTTFERAYCCLTVLLMIAFSGGAQEVDPQLAESNNYVFEGNSLVDADFIEAEKNAQQATLQPGDGIFIPALWWHGVESLDRINVLINYWWGGVTSTGLSPNDSLMHSMMSMSNLSKEKREAWRWFFEYYVFKTKADPGMPLPEEFEDLVTDMNSEQVDQLRQFLLAGLK